MAVQRAVRESVGDAVRDAVIGKRPYLKMAFANPYNLSLLGGTLAAAAATANPILAEKKSEAWSSALARSGSFSP